MKIHFSFLFLTSYILQFLNFPFLASTKTDSFCSCPEPNYILGSTFEFNLQHLLADLPQNASRNNYSYNTTYGKAPDRVYGLAMCYADASLFACKNCLSEASTAMIACCGFRKQGVAWYDACMMRYSDVAFNASNNVGLQGSEPKGDYNKRENLSDPEKFSSTLRQLINKVAINASKSPLKVAAGTTNYTLNANIYTLVQCTRQIPPDECTRCIGDLIDFGIDVINLKGNTSVIRDRTLKTVSCYVRHAFDPFYVISEAHPPWRNAGKRPRETVPIHILTIIIGAMFVLLADVLAI